MRLLSSPWTRAFLVWTVVLMGAATLVALAAVVGFLRAADACFIGTGPCPTSGDPNYVNLEVAFFGFPLIWLVGVLLGVVARAVTTRRRTR